MQKLKSYVIAMRVPFFTASVIPVLLGSAIAWVHTGGIHWFYFFLTLLGGVLLHAGANIINDYFDHLSGTDDINTEFARPFTGGSRVIQDGLLSPREVLAEALILYALASGIGVYLAAARGWEILALGVIGVFSGFFYCAPPFKLVHRGIGEIFIGLNFGVLMTLGAYFVQARSFAWEPFAASLPVAFLIAAVLYINEFQDANADGAVGKNQIVVRLGKKRAVAGYIGVMAAAYVSVGAAVALKVLTPWALLSFAALPFAAKAIVSAGRNYADSKALVPANAMTILSHLVTGIMLSVAYLISGLA